MLLLINLTTKCKTNLGNYSKNHTQVGHTSEFPFGIYWWTLKNLKTQNFEKNEKKKKNAEYIIILLMCTKSHNHMRHSSWDTEFEFFVILGPFYPQPSNNPEKQNFEKMKKTSGNVIILKLCNKKQDHMMYAYSDMEHNRHHFLSF